MRKLLPSLLIGFAVSGVAIAQETETSETPIIDEVISEGQRRGADPAMDAFLRGDFATAEIEFEQNFDRLKRNLRLKETTIQQGVSDAIQAQVTSASGAGISGSTPNSGQIAGNQGLSTSSGVYVNRQSRKQDPSLISSGNDLGSQLYMAGLSEIQLQKFDEAQESFKEALRLNPTLADAHFRLGLLALQNGDIAEAQLRLSKMERELKRCHSRCERLGNRESLETGIAQLSHFLNAQ